MAVLNYFIFVLATLLFAGIALSEKVGGLCFVKGDRAVLPNICSRYLQCEGGRYVVKKCAQGKIFDYVRKVCVASSYSGCHRQCTFNDKKPVKGNQNKYVFCEKGLLKVGSCEGYFNRFTKQCEINYENNLRSIGNHNNQWNLKLQKTDSKCQPGNRKPVTDSCSKYMECDSTTTWVLGECPDCQHFEPESMECVWAWKYYCGSSATTDYPTTSSDEPSSSSESSSPTGGPTSETTPTEGPTSETSPTEGPTSETAPTEGPTSETSPTEGPTSVTSPTEGPTSETAPTEGPTSETSPTEGPTSEATPTEEPTSETTTTDKPTSVTPTITTTTTTTTKATTTTKMTTKATTTKTSTTKPTITTTTPISQCTTEGQKKIYQKGDCKDYLECDSGKWVKKYCSTGYDFDINKLDCIWSWWAKC